MILLIMEDNTLVQVNRQLTEDEIKYIDDGYGCAIEFSEGKFWQLDGGMALDIEVKE